MSWTANIQGSYGANTMTVSWTAPASLPNTYTVTAQPGGLTASVAGSATSATLTTTLSGVAYAVSVVANYSGSTQTATETLISPPRNLPVPITTDVAPWLWYDAADPTTIRVNSSGNLTEWYNKGTSAGSTNANISVSGTVTYGSSNINGISTVNFSSNGYLTTGSIATTAQAYAYFSVVRMPSSTTGFTIIGYSNLQPFLFAATTGIWTGVHNLTTKISSSANIPQSSVQMFTAVNSATLANNIIGLNGTSLTRSPDDRAASGVVNSASSFIMGAYDPSSPAYEVAEIIGYQGEITATQRMQIEGYLAWKWGLQAQLSATHPFSTANMAATMAVYNRPRKYVSTFATVYGRGLVADASGFFYTGNGDGIMKVSPSGTVSTFTTTGGAQNRTGVAVDPSGNVYVHERGAPGYIRKFDSSGNQIYGIFINSWEYGIWADNSGNAYTPFGAALYKYGPTGTLLSTNAFAGKYGAVAFDISNNAYLFNYGDRKLYKIDTAGNATFIAGSGADSSVDGIGAEASFNFAYTPGIFYDNATGNIYLTSIGKVRVITPAGVVRTIAGNGGIGSAMGLDVNSQFKGIVSSGGIEGVVLINNSLYVSDIDNAAIRKISLGTLNQTGAYSSVTSTYQAASDEYGNLYVGSLSGSTNYITKISPTGATSTFAGAAASGTTNGAGSAASFNGPTGVIRDELGNLYVAEYNGNRIRKVSPAGLVTTLVSSITTPLGITMGPDGNIYAATHSNHTIQQITRAGVVSLYAGASGQVGGTDNVNRLSARFNYPCHLAFDRNGIMYVADTQNNKIRKIDASSNVTTFAGNGTTSVINVPHGITFDTANNMYITEYGGAKISKITPSATISTVATGFTNPTYCHIDTAQNLWVSDAGTNYVRHIAINAVPTGSVSITGTLTQGQVITANTSALVDIDGFGSFSYVWSASSTANGVYTTISGATGSTLTLAEAQVGKYIKVAVSYTDGRGTAEAVSAVAVGTIANVNDPATGLAISGTLQRGLTVSANLASLADPDGIVLPYTYRWASSLSASSGFVDISGATSSSYTLTAADIGKYIRLTVGYTNSYGSPDSAVVVSGTTVLAGNTPVSGTLDISGSLTEGSAVRAIANLVDPDGFGALRYTWSTSETSNGVFRVDASGQDLSGITLSYGQTGRHLHVQVSYTDGYGNAENMISSVVGPIAAYPAPNAPTIGTATAGVTSVSLSWSAPTSNSLIALTGYAIYNANNVFIKSVDVSSTSTVITDLVPGIVQQFRVIAVNSRGIASNASALSVATTPTAPSVAALATGQVSEVIDVPLPVAGVAAVAKKITPTVEADGKKAVVYNPEPGVKTQVAVAGLPAEVEKVVVATAAPQNGYTTLKIAAFNASNQSVSNFSAAPITITLNVPGYTAATLLVRTFDEVGGAQRDSTTATRNGDGSYTMTLSHLTYLRISENVPCFVAGTKILTAVGYKAVEDIVDGELVATADGRALPCKVYITEIDETTKENAPYVIPANTFGPRCPAKDLTISPLHAIQISRGVWQIPKMAASLYNGIRQTPSGSSCTYYHLEMPNYLTDNLVAEGTVVESYGARQLAGRRVEYKFNGAAGGFIRTIQEGRRVVAARR